VSTPSRPALLLADERRRVAEACRLLSRSGLVVGTAGNVSVRVGEHVVISPSGVDYEAMSAEDVGVHDVTGVPVDAPLKPSSELPLHLAIYAGTDHTAIVHTHAPASTALSTLVDEVPATHYYTALFGGGVRVAPYATFGSDALARNVADALQERTAALMSNHGAVLVGSVVEKVLSSVSYLEYICDVQLRAMSTGRAPRVLDAQEIAEVARRLAGYGQSAAAASTERARR
jgi:L-fuculose-phosphate aldolase